MIELDWFDKEGNPVIVKGIAQRDIEVGEELVSYGIVYDVKNEEMLKM